jgi:hypothetical protein
MLQNVKPSHGSRTCGGRKEACQHSHRRRFTSAVRAKEANDLSLRNLKRDLINGSGVRVLLGERLSFYHRQTQFVATGDVLCCAEPRLSSAGLKIF